MQTVDTSKVRRAKPGDRLRGIVKSVRVVGGTAYSPEEPGMNILMFEVEVDGRVWVNNDGTASPWAEPVTIRGCYNPAKTNEEIQIISLGEDERRWPGTYIEFNICRATYTVATPTKIHLVEQEVFVLK